MAVTKILARNGGLKQAIEYVLNGDKTQEQVLTAHLNCDPGFEYQQMIDTKRELGKLNGRQCYHIIQSFVPGEITPELALQIATAFAEEYLAGYQVVIGTHTDRHHIHSHILFSTIVPRMNITNKFGRYQTDCVGSTAFPSSSKGMGRNP